MITVKISPEGGHTMRSKLLVSALFVILGAVPVLAIDANDILGVWATDPEGGGGPAHVEISADGEHYGGKIIWLEEPLYTGADEGESPGTPKEDHNNPDPALRSRPIIGLVIMEGFVFDGKDTWHKGTIYDPDNGKTYKCKIRVGDDGELKVRGFIGFSMLGRTEVWTRVDGDG
jgi:uncharacterized protein (DUF2147 family)